MMVEIHVVKEQKAIDLIRKFCPPNAINFQHSSSMSRFYAVARGFIIVSQVGRQGSGKKPANIASTPTCESKAIRPPSLGLLKAMRPQNI